MHIHDDKDECGDGDAAAADDGDDAVNEKPQEECLVGGV